MGTVTWTVTITDGTYTFICDAHPTQMKGSFTAGNVPPPPPPPPPAAKLSGKVTTKAISLTNGRLEGPVVDGEEVQDHRLGHVEDAELPPERARA